MSGLTDADRERIERYLRRPPNRRRPDLLCPDDDEDDLEYGWVECFPGVDAARVGATEATDGAVRETRDDSDL